MVVFKLTSWLDPIFSLSSLGLVSLLFGILFLMLVMFVQKKIIFHHVGWVLLVLFLGLMTLLGLNSSFFGYGYLLENNMSYFGISDKYIAIKDAVVYEKSRGVEKVSHRLYLVNKQTGEVITKKPVNPEVSDSVLVKVVAKENFTQMTAAKKYFYNQDKTRTSASLTSCVVRINGFYYNNIGDKKYNYARLRACFDKQDFAIIKSYQTSDRQKEIFTAVNAQGKVYWQQTAEELGVTDWFSDANVEFHYTTPILKNAEIICLIGGYLLRLNPKTGKVRWKTRL